MSSKARMRKDLKIEKASRPPVWSDEESDEVPVKKASRKPTSGKSSAEKLSTSHRPLSPSSSRRDGPTSESSRSNHFPTPSSSRNRTPETDSEDFTESSDADLTEGDKASRQLPRRLAGKNTEVNKSSTAKPKVQSDSKTKTTANRRQKYDTEPSEFEEITESEAEDLPAMFSEHDSETTGLDSVDRAMRKSRRERRRSSARRAARTRSKSVSAAADRWPEETSRESPIRNPKNSRRGATGNARGPVKPPLKLLSCADCATKGDSTRIAKLDCGHSLCNRCLIKRYKDCLANPNKYSPQCCNQDLPPDLVDRLDDSFRRTWNSRRRHNSRSRHQHHQRASSDPGDNLEDRYPLDQLSIPNSRRRTPKWNDWNRDEVGSGSARTVPTPRREAIAIKGWRSCYNCQQTSEVREGEPSIACRCGAIICVHCGQKQGTCNCATRTCDPLLDSFGPEYNHPSQAFLPPENMSHPRMMRDPRVTGRMTGGPAGPTVDYYGAGTRGSGREAPRGADYDMDYDEYDETDYAPATTAPRGGMQGYARGAREMSAGHERAFDMNSTRERMNMPMGVRDRVSAATAATPAAAAAGYGDYDYEYEYDDYNMPVGATAGDIATYRQQEAAYQREVAAAHASGPGNAFADRRGMAVRRTVGAATSRATVAYEDDYDDGYGPVPTGRYAGDKYGGIPPGAHDYEANDYVDYPDPTPMGGRYPSTGRQGAAATTTTAAAAAAAATATTATTATTKYAGDMDYDRPMPGAYSGGVRGGYPEGDYYDDGYPQDMPPQGPPRRNHAIMAANAAAANGFGPRRGTSMRQQPDYDDEMMDEMQDMHDRDMIDSRTPRQSREPADMKPRVSIRRKDPRPDARGSVPPPSTTRVRHSMPVPGYDDDTRRAVSKPQGNELVLGSRRSGRQDEPDDDEDSDGYDAVPPRRHQSIRARGPCGGHMATTDDDMYNDYDRRILGGPALERHSMAGDFPSKGRRGMRGASAGLVDRYGRNSMPPSPRTAPPYGVPMNGHGPHAGGPPMGGPGMGGPSMGAPGIMGGPMGPMGPMANGLPMRGPGMGPAGPMGMPGPGMGPMGPGMGPSPIGMGGPGTMGPGPIGGPPGPYGRGPSGMPPGLAGPMGHPPPFRDDIYGPPGPPRNDMMLAATRRGPPPGGPPPPIDYNDEAAGGHGPGRRRRRFVHDSVGNGTGTGSPGDVPVPSSTMAGLTGVGTGMTRVEKWVEHVAPGLSASPGKAPR